MGGGLVIAIIMAGGRGRRMGQDVEKPLLEVGGKKMLDIVVDAALGSAVADFFVATSPDTPETAKYCRDRKYKEAATKGSGYHEDVIALLRKYPVFVSIAVDTPFLKSGAIDRLVESYDGASVTGAVPVELIPDGISYGYTFKHEGRTHTPIGINIVTPNEYSKIVSFDEPLLGINVNTPKGLEMARRVACEASRDYY